MFFSMVTRALLRQPGRRALVALTVALGVCLSTALLAVMLDVGDRVNAELKTYGANIVLRPQAAAVVGDLYGELGTTTAGGVLKESDLPKIKTIFWAYNILDFAPFLSAGVSVRGDGAAEPTTAQAVGTWFDKRLELPTGETAAAGVRDLRSWWDVQGTWPEDSDGSAVMVGSTLAAEQGLAVGGDLELTDGGTTLRLTVAGIFDAGSAEDSEIFLPLATLQKLTGRDGQVGWVEVSALTTPDNDLARRAAQDPDSLSARDRETWYCTAYVSSISYQLEEVVGGSVARPVRQVAESEGVVLEKTQLLMLLITAMSLLAAALGIANLVTVSVMERAPEIGLLKAIGASNRAVVALILTETLVVGLIGGALGYLAGLGLAQVIGRAAFGVGIGFAPALVAVMGIFVLAVILLGSLPAIRLILSLRPAEVLHGR
ncbi:ABC transporter permease [Propionicimonas sp.]|uniref:ABC transporter permease n=1 Tax=Propionicimonas sp. TaxID=1955623 RepID=UPI0039E6786C